MGKAMNILVGMLHFLLGHVHKAFTNAGHSFHEVGDCRLSHCTVKLLSPHTCAHAFMCIVQVVISSDSVHTLICAEQHVLCEGTAFRIHTLYTAEHEGVQWLLCSHCLNTCPSQKYCRNPT